MIAIKWQKVSQLMENLALLFLVGGLSLSFGVIFSDIIKKVILYPVIMAFGHLVVWIHRKNHSSPEEYLKDKDKNKD